mmetsp:Transcript_25149/g.79963  ORF Transcript_25149/g.79963 Transcript_25149/m.79963 type:complete len:81 (+) Transcript_25149:650-892(+)
MAASRGSPATRLAACSTLLATLAMQFPLHRIRDPRNRGHPSPAGSSSPPRRAGCYSRGDGAQQPPLGAGHASSSSLAAAS